MFGVLNYFEHFLISASAASSFVSIYAFVSLVCVTVGITSCAVQFKTCVLTSKFKTYKSRIEKKEKGTII